MSEKEIRLILLCENIGELAYCGLLDKLDESNNNDLNELKKQAIQDLLNLYNNKKEKNKKLEKESISKDRIKELIFYIDNDIKARDFRRMHMQHTTTDSYEVVYSASDVKNMLEKLLEE